MRISRIATALSLCASTAAFAGLPGNYGAVPFDQALAEAERDGKPVMVYFTSAT